MGTKAGFFAPETTRKKNQRGTLQPDNCSCLPGPDGEEQPSHAQSHRGCPLPRRRSLVPPNPRLERARGQVLQGKPSASCLSLQEGRGKQEKPKLTPSRRGEGLSSILGGAKLTSLA